MTAFPNSRRVLDNTDHSNEQDYEETFDKLHAVAKDEGVRPLHLPETLRMVVSHLTRMRAGCVCVAGIDLLKRQHVRPVLHGQLETSLLQTLGGPFDMGNIVNFDQVRILPSFERSEDRLFWKSKVIREKVIDGFSFWHLLNGVSENSLGDIFHQGLETRNTCAFVAKGKSSISLGCLKPAETPLLLLEPPEDRPRLRIMVCDDGRWLKLPVTDIRLFDAVTHQIPNASLIEKINSLMKEQDVLLGVGLTHLFTSDPQYFEPVHWLQVNAIHLKHNLLWRLAS
jgi:hypothetical protein